MHLVKLLFCVPKKKEATLSSRKIVKLCAMEMAKSLLGLEAEKRRNLVPLSNDIITSRFRDITEDIMQQVITDVKASPIKVSFQLDESTNVSLCSQFWVFVRYVKEKKWGRIFIL